MQKIKLHYTIFKQICIGLFSPPAVRAGGGANLKNLNSHLNYTPAEGILNLEFCTAYPKKISEERGETMKKRFWSFLLVLCMILTLLPAAALAAGVPGVDFVQNGETRTVTATVSNPAAADSVKLTATMSYNGKVTETASIEKAISGSTFDFELPYYGKWNVSAAFSKGGKSVGTVSCEVAVSASEFNIVCGAATTDVLIESLEFCGATTADFSNANGFNNQIPTIVTLNRFKQYNWDKLPENMYRNPLLTAEENNSDAEWVEFKMGAMKQYIQELLEINPSARFNFYLNDYGMYSFPKLCYENQIPQDQYTLTMVTDGSASYYTFKQAYDGIDDAAAKHAQLVQEYSDFRQGCLNGTVTDYTSNAALPHGSLRIYTYAILDVEPNSRWWVVRKSGDTFGIQDKTFQSRVTGDSRITNHYINGLLTNVEKAGNTDVFKALYNFDDSGFQNARAQGKKLMMLMGTSASIEEQYPIMEYNKFVTTYYGDQYAYFYKGHPGNYTADSPENTAKYAEIGVEMLDPSIAAELFVFFNPDICMSGYATSTYQNVGEDSQDLVLYRSTMEVAYADNGNREPYAAKMDIFLSDLGNLSDTATFAAASGDSDAMKAAKEKANQSREIVSKLIPAGETADRNFMVQFNNTSEKTVSKYEFAIWNYTKNVIHYIGKDASGNYAILANSGEGCDGGENCPSKDFQDVDPSMWYHEAVDYAVEHKLFNGMNATSFAPDLAMTRGMLVTVLHRMDGAPKAEKEAAFVDLTEDWYKDAVAWASENGIVNGLDNEHFNPNGKVTREQAMTMLMRYAKYKGMDVSAKADLSGFTDADKVSEWAQDAVSWAVAVKLINGTTPTTLEPQGESTRAQVATILMRFQTNV